MSPPPFRASRGFTLVELLTVIAIIGILAGILIPVISRIRASAASATCLSNLRGLCMAGRAWIAENQNHMPDELHWQGGGTGSLMPYLDLPPGSNDTNAPTVLTCPTIFGILGPDKLGDRNRTYSINSYACATQNHLNQGQFTAARQAQRITQIERPSAMCFFMDGAFDSSGAALRSVHAGSPASTWSSDFIPNAVFAGHVGRVNVGFLDGHVDAVSPAAIPLAPPSANRTQPFWGSLQ